MKTNHFETKEVLEYAQQTAVKNGEIIIPDYHSNATKEEAMDTARFVYSQLQAKGYKLASEAYEAIIHKRYTAADGEKLIESFAEIDNTHNVVSQITCKIFYNPKYAKEVLSEDFTLGVQEEVEKATEALKNALNARFSQQVGYQELSLHQAKQKEESSATTQNDQHVDFAYTPDAQEGNKCTKLTSKPDSPHDPDDNSFGFWV